MIRILYVNGGLMNRGGIGDIRINQTADKKEIFEMLDFFREG